MTNRVVRIGNHSNDEVWMVIEGSIDIDQLNSVIMSGRVSSRGGEVKTGACH